MQSAELPSQVDSLLKAVEATNIFESEMARRFEGAAVDREPSSSEDAEAVAAGEGGGGAAAAADDSSPASRVRERYEKLQREKQRGAENESPQRRREQVRRGERCAAAAADACMLAWLAPAETPLTRPLACLPAGACHICGGGQDQL